MTKDKAIVKGWNSLPQHISKVTFDKIEKALQITAKAKEEEWDKRAKIIIGEFDKKIKQLQLSLESHQKVMNKRELQYKKLQKDKEELIDNVIKIIKKDLKEVGINLTLNSKVIKQKLKSK